MGATPAHLRRFIVLFPCLRFFAGSGVDNCRQERAMGCKHRSLAVAIEDNVANRFEMRTRGRCDSRSRCWRLPGAFVHPTLVFARCMSLPFPTQFMWVRCSATNLWTENAWDICRAMNEARRVYWVRDMGNNLQSGDSRPVSCHCLQDREAGM